MAYTADEKARAVEILKRWGGITREARQEIDTTLGRKVSTSTLSSWFAKTETKSKNRNRKPAAKKPQNKAPALVTTQYALDNDLTPLQHKWVNEYLCCWNATEAAKRAGYPEDSAYQRGYENTRHPKLQAIIAERLAEHTMSADEAMARLTVHARTSIQDMVDPLTGEIDLMAAVKNGAIQAIKEYKISDTPFGQKIEVKLYDKQDALQTIWKNQRAIAGLPTEVVAVLPIVQEIFELLTEMGRSPTALFDKMLQRAHAEAAKLANSTGPSTG